MVIFGEVQLLFDLLFELCEDVVDDVVFVVEMVVQVVWIDFYFFGDCCGGDVWFVDFVEEF